MWGIFLSAETLICITAHSRACTYLRIVYVILFGVLTTLCYDVAESFCFIQNL